MSSAFKSKPLEQRKEEALSINAKYPGRVPIVVEHRPNCKLPTLDKKKFLVPKDLNMGQFIYIIRKRIKLQSERAIFVFINNTLPSSTATMGTIYDTHKDEDGFLYVNYDGESTFGK